MNLYSKVLVKTLIDKGEVELKTGPFGTQLKASEYVDSGTPVINVRNIGFGDIRSENLEFITPETRDRLSAHVLKEGDIVFGRKGAVERHAFIRKHQNGWFQGSDCLRIRFNSGRVIPRFASYFFLTNDHQNWMMNQCSHGATMASLNQGILERIQLPLPSVLEQEHIVRLLSAYDDLIENNRRRIKILEEMARSLYRKWFVHFHYPDHESVPLVNSSLGSIPKGWEVKKISDLFKTTLGGTPSRSRNEYWENGTVAWINSGKVNDLRVIEPSECITSEALENSSTKLMPIGTTVLAITGATLGQVSYLEIETSANQSVVGVTDVSGKFSEWLYLMISDRIQEIIKHASGGAQQHINKEVVNDVLISLPDKNVSEKFKYVIQPIFRQVSNLLFSNKNLRKTRDLLLPRLLSGRISLGGKVSVT